MTAPMAREGLRQEMHMRFLPWTKKVLAHITAVREFCHDCGRRQPIVWWADDELWKFVTGRYDEGGVLCPVCFDRRATRLGILLHWTPAPRWGFPREPRTLEREAAK